MTATPDLLSLDDLSALLGVPRTTLDDRVRRHRIKPVGRCPSASGVGRWRSLFQVSQVREVCASRVRLAQVPPPPRSVKRQKCPPAVRVDPDRAEAGDLAQFWVWHAALMREAGVRPGRKPYFEGGR